MANWGHMLWQRKGIRMEEFYSMPRRTRALYIASEKLEMENPQESTNFIAGFLKELAKKKKKKH